MKAKSKCRATWNIIGNVDLPRDGNEIKHIDHKGETLKKAFYMVALFSVFAFFLILKVIKTITN